MGRCCTLLAAAVLPVLMLTLLCNPPLYPSLLLFTGHCPLHIVSNIIHTPTVYCTALRSLCVSFPRSDSAMQPG
jgi:hypothetical protein